MCNVPNLIMRNFRVAVKVRKTIDILFEKCYTITRFCENPLKVEDDWIKDYALEEEI